MLIIISKRRYLSIEIDENKCRFSKFHLKAWLASLPAVSAEDSEELLMVRLLLRLHSQSIMRPRLSLSAACNLSNLELWTLLYVNFIPQGPPEVNPTINQANKHFTVKILSLSRLLRLPLLLSNINLNTERSSDKTIPILSFTWNGAIFVSRWWDKNHTDNWTKMMGNTRNNWK